MLENIKPAKNSIKSIKRVGRGQGSGMGKTSTRGGKGQTARTGYRMKRGFEGGQQPIQRRLPKVGFTSMVIKPYVINVDKQVRLSDLDSITLDSIRNIYNIPRYVQQVKLIGKNVVSLSQKIALNGNVITSRSYEHINKQ